MKRLAWLLLLGHMKIQRWCNWLLRCFLATLAVKHLQYVTMLIAWCAVPTHPLCHPAFAPVWNGPIEDWEAKRPEPAPPKPNDSFRLESN